MTYWGAALLIGIFGSLVHEVAASGTGFCWQVHEVAASGTGFCWQVHEVAASGTGFCWQVHEVAAYFLAGCRRPWTC